MFQRNCGTNPTISPDINAPPISAEHFCYNEDMGKINLLIANANDNLSGKLALIKKAIKTAEDYTFGRLDINWDIDVLVTTRIYDIIIPEDGVGGRTITSDFIELSINNDVTETKLAEMLVHELCHAARWGKNGEWADSLFKNLICEGLAVYFEKEFASSNVEKQFYLETVISRSKEDNQKILERLQNSLDSNSYDYDAIFFNGNESLPRWAGYSLGLHLVEQYLAKTGKTIPEAYADNYSNFKN